MLSLVPMAMYPTGTSSSSSIMTVLCSQLVPNGCFPGPDSTALWDGPSSPGPKPSVPAQTCSQLGLRIHGACPGPGRSGLGRDESGWGSPRICPIGRAEPSIPRHDLLPPTHDPSSPGADLPITELEGERFGPGLWEGGGGCQPPNNFPAPAMDFEVLGSRRKSHVRPEAKHFGSDRVRNVRTAGAMHSAVAEAKPVQRKGGKTQLFGAGRPAAGHWAVSAIQGRRSPAPGRASRHACRPPAQTRFWTSGVETSPRGAHNTGMLSTLSSATPRFGGSGPWKRRSPLAKSCITDQQYARNHFPRRYLDCTSFVHRPLPRIVPRLQERRGSSGPGTASVRGVESSTNGRPPPGSVIYQPTPCGRWWWAECLVDKPPSPPPTHCGWAQEVLIFISFVFFYPKRLPVKDRPQFAVSDDG